MASGGGSRKGPRLPVLLLLTLTLVPHALPQTPTECPLAWVPHGGHCYHFVFHPLRTRGEAALACEMDGAGLVSVNSDAEDSFINDYLKRLDVGRAVDEWEGAGTDFLWQGDGTRSVGVTQHWHSPSDVISGSLFVVYVYNATGQRYDWSRAPGRTALAYICEVSLAESGRVEQEQRDFSFGSALTDASAVPRGPVFSVQPKTVVVAGETTDSVSLECTVTADPPATYRWYRHFGAENQEEVTTDPRHTLTNGRLTFSPPERRSDEGQYQCTAQNAFGTVVSLPASITFGFLAQFSNDPPGAVTALQYQGTYIRCNPPNHNPRILYQWFKNSPNTFVRPEMNTYTFISHNGALYFSETQQADGGFYHCVVTLTSLPDQSMSTLQPPSRVSLGIQLVITGDTANEYGPLIHNDFPAVFPLVPLRGDDVRLECFAYGRMPIVYSWSRAGRGMPANAQYSDSSRVLVIPDAQLEDSGQYTCLARRGSAASDRKSFYLDIQAKPYFLFPLRDQHLDEGSQLTWRCEAGGVPRVTYSWLKNGRPLLAVPGVLEVRANVLFIGHANAAHHDGMYQCVTSNRHGVAISSAQLRVLSFRPTFVKRPVETTMLATVGGNATLLCRPEAAPKPEIHWLRNGVDLGVTPISAQGRLLQLPSGDLRIIDVTSSDEGLYRCVASNVNGEAFGEGKLIVVQRTTLSVVPQSVVVPVNSSAFLPCLASFNARHQDLVYVWRLNGHVLDVDNSPYYARGNRGWAEGLYVRHSTFFQAGEYSCQALTTQDSAMANASLTVLGPPGEPGGVLARVTGRTAVIRWVEGATHGSPALSFAIEFATVANPEWRSLVDELPPNAGLDPAYPGVNEATVDGLLPGNQYHFRVFTRNIYGAGPTSIPSPFYNVEVMAPTLAPETVGGGGGTVGMLIITWTPLDEENHNGPDVGYRVFWRKHSTAPDGLFQWADVEGYGTTYAALVGVANFYLEYEVKVAAFNALGMGPLSESTVILSAEDMPALTPYNIRGHELNSTAIMVYWDPVPDGREGTHGRVMGYQINYWIDGQASPILNANDLYGQRSSGPVVGLMPGQDVWVNVQVFTVAGMGPISDDFMLSTTNAAPSQYPYFIEVHSHGPHSVFVTWQGISTYPLEEPLRGYKVLYMAVGDDLKDALYEVTINKETTVVLHGLDKGVIYQLRILGYSVAGDGKKSPITYFTLGGGVRYDPVTTEVMALGCSLRSSLALLGAALFICVLTLMP